MLRTTLKLDLRRRRRADRQRRLFRWERKSRSCTMHWMLPTNTSLIRRVRDVTDGQSWREFVALYEPLLLSYVRNRGLTNADASDVVQEIFINLLRVLPNFNLDHERGRFRTWLWQVTMNAIADYFRRRKSQGRAEDVWREQAPTEITDEPDEAWVQSYRQRILEFVMPQVKAVTQDKTWQCFEEFVLKNRPGNDIAAEVGLTANAVRVNANRVMDKVRVLCADYLEEMDDDQERMPR